MARNTEKEAFWRGHMESQRGSGLSVRGYCLREGLKEPSFHGWRRELARRDGGGMAPGGKCPPRFVAVHAPAPGSAPGVIEVLFGPVVVRVHGGVEASSLRGVFDALGVLPGALPGAGAGVGGVSC